MNRLFFLSLFFFSFIPAEGQSLVLLKKVLLPAEATSVSIDKVPHVYIADKKGNVHKFDAGGDLLFTYSPQQQGNIKSVEAASTLNILLFYEGLQEYRFLDRFLTLTSTRTINPDIFARLVTVSADNNLWVFDDKQYTLQKINLTYQTPEIVTSLTNVAQESFQGSFLKEYQNLVFLSDINTGIYVFDNLGNYIKKLPLPGASYFNFYKDELYYLTEGVLEFYNIYDGEKRTLQLPAQELYLFGLAIEKQLYLISKNSMDIYGVVEQ